MSNIHLPRKKQHRGCLPKEGGKKNRGWVKSIFVAASNGRERKAKATGGWWRGVRTGAAKSNGNRSFSEKPTEEQGNGTRPASQYGSTQKVVEQLVPGSRGRRRQNRSQTDRKGQAKKKKKKNNKKKKGGKEEIRNRKTPTRGSTT